MKIGIVDILTDSAPRGLRDRLYGTVMRKQFMNIMPQAVAAWCRQMGHDVYYSTYYGQGDLLSLVPAELDVLFVSSYSHASSLAYIISKVYRKRGTMTVIGGAHARAAPTDSQKHFDIVVHDCDKTLVADILGGHYDPPVVVSSGRPLSEIPSVEERWPEIRASSFYSGRPLPISVVPLLSSTGCPYSCNFCVDWKNDYLPQPKERLLADLDYLSRHQPKLVIAFHDPNFAVRFDETITTIESIPEHRRNPYLMESSLSVLRGARLPRLQSTNCIYIAPGIESWTDYSNKAGVAAKHGWNKLERVVEHLRELVGYGFGLQTNFVFGIDSDAGPDPVEITKEFIHRMPEAWMAVSIPCGYSGTPLYDQLYRDSRILKSMPYAFYYTPYLTMVPKNYDPLEYYDHLLNIGESFTSRKILRRRITAQGRPGIRFIHSLRHVGALKQIAQLREIRDLLASDTQFRDFHLGNSPVLPEFYHHKMDKLLGRYAELFPRKERHPILEEPASIPSQTLALV